MEDYMLYPNKAKSQVNSRMETPKLIGVIQLNCYSKRYSLLDADS